MASISEAIKKQAGRGGPAPICGIAAEVISLTKDGSLTVRSLYDTALCKAGETLKIEFQEDLRSKNLDNIKKGMGGAQGSILMLENCTRSGEGKITARWVTTAVSSAKKLDETSGHAERRVVRHMIETPRIYFKNPTLHAGEPEYIRFSMFDQEMKARVKEGGQTIVKTFDRNWILAKLKDVPDSKYVSISSLSVDASKSVLVDSIESARKEIEDIIAKNDGVAMIRVHDSEGTVEVAEISARYGKSPNEVTNSYFTGYGRVIPKIGNEILAEEVAAGNWKLEIIPCRKLYYLGDTRMKLVNDLINNNPNVIKGYSLVFGARDNDQAAWRLTDAAVVEMPTSDGSVAIKGLPLPLSRGRIERNYVPTAHFNLKPAPGAMAGVKETNTDEVSDDDIAFGVDDLVPVFDADADPLPDPFAKNEPGRATPKI